MNSSIEVLFTPAEFTALAQRDLSETACVVFDVLRATSSMVTALAHGAQAVVPVATIPDALAWKERDPDVLLAGERNGLRIRAVLTGGVEFDLGNSPREFEPERVRGRTIVMTTTNGTRALQACRRGAHVWVGAFLNLNAVVEALRRVQPRHLLVVCSGTIEQAAFEDALAAGALCEAVWDLYKEGEVVDSVQLALEAWRRHANDLAAGLGSGRNGRRLLARPELRDDVGFCAMRDRYAFAPTLDANAIVRWLK
ncbi:MAG TPA: 2-phosphosulfolactate phosphatase [Candidatus Paceibacterota bacterium]|nr:2-phosphosulfolactate phosphatase [Candidatus Paceibacterota bacterium]